ncbi:hypothetical protein ID866_4572 [Astraeus odoratus]|nr:hypothetical protein ID866_4572 [Astraeus odoratus]
MWMDLLPIVVTCVTLDMHATLEPTVPEATHDSWTTVVTGWKDGEEETAQAMAGC